MNAHRLAAASALIACALSVNVHAEVLNASASASITNLTFTLIDLDLSDGITPSVSFFSEPTGGKYGETSSGVVGMQITRANGLTSQAGDTIYDYPPSGYLLTGDISKSLNGTSSSAASSGTISGNPVGSAGNLITASTASLDTSAAQADKAVTAYSSVWSTHGQFFLSANTRLVIQGTYDVSASVDGLAAVAESASAKINVVIGTGYYTSFYKQVSTQLQKHVSFGNGLTGEQSITNSFLQNIDNITSGELVGFVATNASTSVAIVAVPEPEAWALVATGLGLLAFGSTRSQRARRRQQKLG